MFTNDVVLGEEREITKALSIKMALDHFKVARMRVAVNRQDLEAINFNIKKSAYNAEIL